MLEEFHSTLLYQSPSNMINNGFCLIEFVNIMFYCCKNRGGLLCYQNCVIVFRDLYKKSFFVCFLMG